jgi:peptidoglycan/xylan/chitin deacetylase (PgdA/CDA1 family)
VRQALIRHRRSAIGVALGVVLLGAVTIALLIIGGSSPASRPAATSTTAGQPSLSPSPVVTVTPSPTAVSPMPSSTPTVRPSSTPTPTAASTPTPAPNRVLPASLQGVEWYALPTSRKIIALTFDAGSGDQGLARILKTLADKKVPGTFFLTGQFIQRYPSDTRAIAAVDQHSIGNHTVDHPHMNQLSDAAIRDEILGAERSIIGVTGRQPWPLFRFPYGESSSRTIAIANSLGYGSIRWTVDTLGWEGRVDSGGHSTRQSVDTVIARALNGARPGEIVLMHVGAAPDGTTLDADALPAIIDGLRARSYSFVAIWDFITGLS